MYSNPPILLKATPPPTISSTTTFLHGTKPNHHCSPPPMAAQTHDHHHHHHNLHFLIVPIMSQSHLIPMTDFAKLLALHGSGGNLTITIIITPLNAARFQPIIDRATTSGLKIHLLSLRFPSSEAGLPENCENIDSLASLDHAKQFFSATAMLKQPLEKIIAELKPPPSCLITSNVLPWASEVARKFRIPMYVFNTFSCFSTLLFTHRIKSVSLDLVLDMPQQIEFKKSQLPQSMKPNLDEPNWVQDQMKATLASARGVLVNNFEEMETKYVEEYTKAKPDKVWCIGPVSLCNKEVSDKMDRGNKATIDEHHCLKWLDSKNPNSVIYACFGSLCHIPCSQLKEIGLGLESSNRPFIWTIRRTDNSAEVEEWLETEGFEERNKERGLLIKGWAPQVLILSHQAVGGFLTHCGWNSTLEGVCAGVPMITWPMFAEQFYNEKLIIEVLRIGVRVGVEVGMQREDEEKDGVFVKREQVKKAIEGLMSDGEGGGERRRIARELGEMAKRSVEERGSSYLNMKLFIKDVKQHVNQSNGFPNI